MNSSLYRRQFLKTPAAAAAAYGLSAMLGDRLMAAPGEPSQPLYRISLAEWSLHRTLLAGKLDNLDFPKIARTQFDIEAVEYVNRFFKDKARDEPYLAELNRRAKDHDVKNLLIMIDDEGNLGDPDENRRKQAIENHRRWVDAARTLGCHSIRVNARSQGSYEEQLGRAADGLRQLSEIAATADPIGVIVENHGGLSSNGAWLAAVIQQVDLPNCGTLPDFGNFHLGGGKDYDRYQGVRELMPFAKAVSAKSHEFDAQGKELKTDYEKMMKIVVDAGYRGYVGIEYEGQKHSEIDGIRLTKNLLVHVRDQLAAAG